MYCHTRRRSQLPFPPYLPLVQRFILFDITNSNFMYLSRAVASLEEAAGHQHLAGGTGWVRTKFSPSAAVVRGSQPPDFFVYFSYKIIRSDAFFGSKNGHYQCFYQDPYALGEMKTVGSGCRMRPEWPRIEAKGRKRGRVLGEGAASHTS